MPKNNGVDFEDPDFQIPAEAETVESVAPLTAASLFVEERLEFVLEDGSRIYFIDAKDISAADSARMSRIQKVFEGALKSLERNPNDADAQRRFEKIAGEFVRFVLPDIPEALFEKLRYGQRGIILNHWLNNSNVGSLGKKAQRAS